MTNAVEMQKKKMEESIQAEQKAQGGDDASGDKGGYADNDIGARAAVQQDGAVASGNCGGCHTRAGEERKHAA